MMSTSLAVWAHECEACAMNVDTRTFFRHNNHMTLIIAGDAVISASGCTLSTLKIISSCCQEAICRQMLATVRNSLHFRQMVCFFNRIAHRHMGWIRD